MSYRFLEHTGDVRMEATGATREELFTEALRGMFSYLKPKLHEGEAKREVRVVSPDQTALLIDFLNEALRLSQTHKEAYREVKFQKLEEISLEAELHGNSVASFEDDIKAVTYHEADVRRDEKGEWIAKLVFDI